MKKLNQKIILTMLVFMPSILSAAGIEKANTLMQNLVSALHAVAIATITAAIMWMAYGVMWGGKRIQDFGGIIVGAILLASAAEIAALLMS